MKKTITILFMTLLCCIVQTKAQTVSFSYDNDGNMTERKLVVVRPSGVKASPKDSVSVTDRIGEQKVTIYPNPTWGIFQVAVTQFDSKQKSYFHLYSLSGTKLQQKNLTGESTDIDISNYPPGTYLLDVFLGDKVSRWKVIKQ
jgi:hypothetical protein